MSLLFALVCQGVLGQSGEGLQVAREYPTAQKRLLLLNTLHFFNFISGRRLDQDSLLTMASGFTGVSKSFAFDEGLDALGTSMADHPLARKLNAPKDKLDLRGKISDFLRLAIVYLHRPGTHLADLDSADFFLEKAIRLSRSESDNAWLKECSMLKGELYAQRGDLTRSRLQFSEITRWALRVGNESLAARAYTCLAQTFVYQDSIRGVYISKALLIYRKLNNKEKMIDLLGELFESYQILGDARMEECASEMLSLARTIGFKHTMWMENIMAYCLLQRGKDVEALQVAKDGLRTARWTGVKPFEVASYIRIGSAYMALSSFEESIRWFTKAMNEGEGATLLLWYKSLFYAATVYNNMLHQPRKSLEMMQLFTTRFPPVSDYQKMQVHAVFGETYEKLMMYDSADKEYTLLYETAKAHRDADPVGELESTYNLVGAYYVLHNELKKARLFFGLTSTVDDQWSAGRRYKYFALYKMDSAEGRYKEALRDHIRYKIAYDSDLAREQQDAFTELTLEYEARKKDENIKVLKQRAIADRQEADRNRTLRDLTIIGAGCLLLVVGLLWSQFRLKQRTNREMRGKNLSLERLAEEREWLLTEVNERVASNLQTVISFLQDQAANLKDDALKAIENSQRRIYAMSLIHQKLYGNELSRTIDMAVYLPEFIHFLEESFGTEGRIRFMLDIEPVQLGAAKAIPLGIMVNEAVTNSIKYAFSGRERGTVKVSMRRIGKRILLGISDDGVGFDRASGGAAAGLGIKLLKGLTEDINGVISIGNDHGTHIVIEFELDGMDVI